MIPESSAPIPVDHKVSNCYDSSGNIPDSNDHPDSGHESSDETTTMSEETKVAIVRQVESYFSEENLRKDAFLLKHVKRNRDGFVSLKLIASLRRVKQLTKNWKDVANAVQQKSTVLLVNEEGNKVRRKTALPLDLLLLSRGKRIVLVHGLKSTATDEISRTFSGHGNIVSMRLFKSEEEDRVMRTAYPHLDLASSALLEYESAAIAEKAVKSIQSNLMSWRSSLGAVIFGEPVTTHRTATFTVEHVKETGRRRSRTLTDSRSEEMFPLRQKSHSYTGFERIDFIRTKTRSEVHLHRQPLGPDGSRGFHKNRII
jgi:hypothetical protein